MQIVLPNTVFLQAGTGLAPRPESLAGLTIGFLDGWGRKNGEKKWHRGTTPAPA